MKYGSYNPSARYRQRSQRRLTGIVYTCILLSFTFGFGVWLGGLRVDQNYYILRQEKKALESQYAEVQNEITQLRAEAQTANVRLEQLKVSYNEVLPDGPMQDIVNRIREQIESGVDPKRIVSVILSARPPQNCDEANSKRLLIVTPNYEGPESKISLENGVISIWGEGKSSKDGKNNEQAWYDSAKPVKIFFQPRDGVVTHKEGVLPLYHSLVIKDREYRFTISADAKSFSKITFDSCDYP